MTVYQCRCAVKKLHAHSCAQLPLLVSVGVLALAKYTDDKWYRAQVTRVLGHQLEVELIDFGTLICVSASDG